MKKLFSALLVMALLLSVVACKQTSEEINQDKNNIEKDSSNNPISSDTLPTDENLVDRTLYLFDGYVLPVYWWAGAGSGSLDVNESEDIEPLPDTPENTTFFQVMRFNSIAEMKRATEQVVTKEYAQKHLYPFLEENMQFLERDNKLYINTSAGRGAPPFAPVSATVLSKTQQEALLSVVFRAPDDEEEVHELELKKEDDIWKLNSFPYLD